MLGLAARRATHYVRFAHFVRTSATKVFTNRAARAAASPALLGAPEARCAQCPRAFAGKLLVFGGTANHLGSRQAVPGGGDLWGAEEASPGHKQSSGLFVPGERLGHWPSAACKASPGGGARSALRKPSRRACLSEVNAVNASELRDATANRASQRSRREARPPQCEPPPGTACRDASKAERRRNPLQPCQCPCARLLTSVTKPIPASSQAIWATVWRAVRRVCNCGIRSASAT